MRVFFSAFFLSLVHLATTQPVARLLRDFSTRQPVPYATIKILNTEKGDMADDQGAFTLAIAQEDSVMISCIGYEPLRLRGKDLAPILFLHQKSRIMPTVRIGGKVQPTLLTIGDLRRKSHDAISWGPSDQKEEFAQRLELPDSTRTYQLKAVYLSVGKIHCWGAILLHVYAADPLTGNPGDELALRLITVNPKDISKGRLKLQMERDSLYFESARYFFVSVSWPPHAAANPCTTTLRLEKSDQATTFSRTLTSKEYAWFPVKYVMNGKTTFPDAGYCIDVLLLY